MSGDIIVGAAKQGHDLLDWATPIFTLLGVFVVGLYTLYAKHQRDEAKRANDLTEIALREAQISSMQALAESRTSGVNAIIQARTANEIAYEATRRSNELAEKALIYGQRSWLIPDVHPSSPFKEGSVWKVAFYISNTGNVPGIMINAFARVDTDPDFQYGNPQMSGVSGAIILPGSIGEEGGWRVTADVPASIPEEQLQANPGAGVCVSCSVKYKDVFSDQWETERAWIRGKDGRWYNHPYFNVIIK